MKNYFLLLCLLLSVTYKACAYYEPDWEYFNLFTQEIIPNKSLTPFLLVYSEPFYHKDDIVILDENTESWMKYFNNTWDYTITDAVIKLVDKKHFINLKKGEKTHRLFKDLPNDFYEKYKEGIEYLIQAKYLEPYMKVVFVANLDAFYYEETDRLDASQLDFDKTVQTLSNLYQNTAHKEIKQRYGYQLLRFYHYNLKFQKAIDAFHTYVEPLGVQGPIYYYALDQKAGAERGLHNFQQANWDFFQVFIHARNRKQSAYNSMKLSNNHDFSALLEQCTSDEEKNWAYFLLAYNSYNNPIPFMQKMYAIDPQSDILKVVVARALNQLERGYLPLYVGCQDDCEQKDKKLPIFKETYYYSESDNFINSLIAFLTQYKAKDEYMQMAQAYLMFLKKDYNKCEEILTNTHTRNPEYLAQINQLRMLNDIVSQPVIDEAVERVLAEKYFSYFKDPERKTFYFFDRNTDTNQFLKDILANRYFLQGDYAKSYLMNNLLSDLHYNPDIILARQLDAFYQKKNKNKFEEYMAKSFNDVGDIQAFFQLMYGDHAMRNGDFAEAASYYQKAKNFQGIPRYDFDWKDDGGYEANLKSYPAHKYNGFSNISSLVFGHNVWESYNSPANITMVSESFVNEFPFIPKSMNKLQIAEVAMQLEDIGKQNSESGAKANQLLGNLMYNTSKLGYFRELFVMDLNNQNSPKFHFDRAGSPNHYYFKWYGMFPYATPDDFEVAMHFYNQALSNTDDREQQAQILFQMACAEQGQYYQWEEENRLKWDYRDNDYYEKREAQKEEFKIVKNAQFRTTFLQLKNQYRDTKTSKALESSCSYYKYYLSK